MGPNLPRFVIGIYDPLDLGLILALWIRVQIPELRASGGGSETQDEPASRRDIEA